MPRPHVLLSAAVSLDGFLDDTGPERLLLSGAADFDRVDEVRASCDAILVGAAPCAPTTPGSWSTPPNAAPPASPTGARPIH